MILIKIYFRQNKKEINKRGKIILIEGTHSPFNSND